MVWFLVGNVGYAPTRDNSPDQRSSALPPQKRFQCSVAGPGGQRHVHNRRRSYPREGHQRADLAVSPPLCAIVGALSGPFLRSFIGGSANYG